MARLRIDDREIEAGEGRSLLEAAHDAGIYLPALCYHPSLPPWKDLVLRREVYQGREKVLGETHLPPEHEGCRLCLVEIEGELEPVRACLTLVRKGLVVRTQTNRVKEMRQANLARILATHPHACLTCAQREGCDRIGCSLNVPVPERCCSLLGNCELQKVAEYIGIPGNTPRYVFRDKPRAQDAPLFLHDYNLCIACLRCVRVCKDVRGVETLGATYKEGALAVGTVAESLPLSECKFCGACVEVCPTGTLMDKVVEGAKVTARKLSEEDRLVPCRPACPAGTDVPRYVRLAAEGKYGEATAVIRERVPFPLVLGHVCFHPCEAACRRGELNEPVSICAIKRFVAENDDGRWRKRLKEVKPTGKQVAIVGAGPAGLTASYYLARKGHAVTLYDSLPEPGGMLFSGIPAYRLPKKVVKEEVAVIIEQGIAFQGGKSLGKDFTLEGLKSQGYDAVLLATGASLAKRIPLEGSELSGVLWGLDFLREVNLESKPALGEQVVVIGGGNVAIDAAMVSLRSGAKKVELACLEKREEMPAYLQEIARAEEEGVMIHTAWGPKRILGEGGKVKGMELKRCTSVFDSEGRFSPTYDESATTILEADTVILAIGQSVDFFGLDKLSSQAGAVAVDDALRCADGVFACGDSVTGPKSVIEAIASARKASSFVDKFLGSDGNLEEPLAEVVPASGNIGREGGFAARSREEVSNLSAEERVRDFEVIERSLSEPALLSEASRCLRCVLRLDLAKPYIPPEKWLPFNEESIARIPEREGVFQLLDENKEVILISGTMSLRASLLERLAQEGKGRYFGYEEEAMYTQRESELISQYLQAHGRMPEGNDELSDLF
jgi:formate dehydrogenase beta subunit